VRSRPNHVRNVQQRQPHLEVTLPGADSVSVSAAFFSPSHSSSFSLSHHVACIPAVIAWRLNGSLRIRLCSANASRRKSNSPGPDFPGCRA